MNLESDFRSPSFKRGVKDAKGNLGAQEATAEYLKGYADEMGQRPDAVVPKGSMNVPTSNSSDCTNGAPFLARPDAAPPKRRCDAFLETGEQCVLTFDHPDDEHIFEDTSPPRPDAVVPKEVLHCPACGKPFNECDGHSLAAHIEATAPPSDAAPVKKVQLDDGPVPDATRVALWERALDLIEWANDLRVGSRPDVGKWGEERRAFHDAILAHPEDALGGPWESQSLVEQAVEILRYIDTDPKQGLVPDGRVELLRRTLNRLKGETDD